MQYLLGKIVMAKKELVVSELATKVPISLNSKQGALFISLTALSSVLAVGLPLVGLTAPESPHPP